jgi:hypothetical protein
VGARDEARRERGGFGRRGNATPGSGFLGLGASKGERISREEGREEGVVVVHHAGSADRSEAAILEGARKAMSGIPPEGQPTGGDSAENASVQLARVKGEGGAAKPYKRLRRVVIR